MFLIKGSPYFDWFSGEQYGLSMDSMPMLTCETPWSYEPKGMNELLGGGENN